MQQFDRVLCGVHEAGVAGRQGPVRWSKSRTTACTVVQDRGCWRRTGAPASEGCKFEGSTHSMCGPAGALRRSGTTGTQRHASICGGPIEPACLLFCVRSSVPRSAIIHFSHSEITDDPRSTTQRLAGWCITVSELSRVLPHDIASVQDRVLQKTLRRRAESSFCASGAPAMHISAVLFNCIIASMVDDSNPFDPYRVLDVTFPAKRQVVLLEIPRRSLTKLSVVLPYLGVLRSDRRAPCT